MRIHQNPNGFAVVTLYELEDGSSERIHAWGDHVPDGDIHQHRASFESMVLEGFFNEEIWTYEDDPEGDWERMTVDCINEGGYRVDVLDRTRCRVQIAEVLVHRQGISYERKATDLHRVFPVKLPVVTRVNFGPVTNRIHTMIRKIEESNGG